MASGARRATPTPQQSKQRISATKGGVVQSIELRYTHVRTADGRDIFIPSSQLFKNPLINFTRDGLRRYSFTVGIDYSDDPVGATEFLLEAVQGVSGVMATPGPGVVIAGLQDAWAQLEVFYWIDTFDKDNSLGSVQTGAMAAVREALRERDYTISCDTVHILSRFNHSCHSALSRVPPLICTC